MATISSPGIGSGLDIRSIVSQLVELEKQPLKQVEKRADLAQLRLSTVGEITSRVAALDDALKELTRASTYRDRTVQSGSTAITGTAVFTATPATYSVQVNQLARGQSVQSAAVASSEAVGPGTLTIDMGTWSGGSFTPNGDNTPLSITVGPTDTLADVAARINEANGGVSASIVNDSGGAVRLVIRSRATGENQGFRIQVVDAGDGNLTDGMGLSRLAYDPENVPPATTLTLGQSAQDTVALVDGVQVRSPTAVLADAIPGVTLTVSATTTAPVNVQITQNTETTRKAIGAFVEAYNALESALSDALRYDAATRKAGPLQGDTTMVTLQGRLRGLLSERGPDGRTWSDLGVQLGRDGKLAINDSRLSAALSDLSAVEATLNADQPSSAGVVRRWRDTTQSWLGTDGRLGLKRSTIESELERLSRQKEQINQKAAQAEQRLLAQYSRLDTTVSRLNALNAYVSQQVAQWNKKTE